MATTVNADASTGGVVLTGDGSGVLELQAAGVTKVTINGSGVTLANPLPVASGGTGATTLSGITVGNATTATTSTNLAGGSAGVVPFQSGAGATSFTAVGTSGQVLTSAGAGTPTWSTPILLSGANTWTGTQSFLGTSSAVGLVLTDAAETVTVSATAATGTINYDVTTQSVLYYTTNASANWTVNFRGSAGTSLNTLMAIGQSITVAFLVQQGATAYYNNAITIDGVSITPKYQGGTAWSSGNASSIDVYSYTIIKTAASTYTLLASQTKFA